MTCYFRISKCCVNKAHSASLIGITLQRRHRWGAASFLLHFLNLIEKVLVMPPTSHFSNTRSALGRTPEGTAD